MIPRDSRPDMARIWEPETKFRIWLNIETQAAEAMAKLGLIPKSVAEAVKKRGRFRHRPHRRDRGRGEARRHRLSDQRDRERRTRGAFPAPRHDLLRRARYLLQRSARAGRRSAHRRRRWAACRAESPRARAQEHADRRAQPRRARRADHVRAQACLCLRRIRPRPGAARRGTGRGRNLRHLRRGRHLCPCRPAGRSLRGRRSSGFGPSRSPRK